MLIRWNTCRKVHSLLSLAKAKARSKSCSLRFVQVYLIFQGFVALLISMAKAICRRTLLENRFKTWMISPGQNVGRLICIVTFVRGGSTMAWAR